MALNSLLCADVPLSTYTLSHQLSYYDLYDLWLHRDQKKKPAAL